MKNLFKISLILLVAGVIFASCNSSLSITKRRYNKGYYVQHSHHKHVSPKDNEPDKVNTAKKDHEEFLALAKASEQEQAGTSGSARPEQPKVIAAAVGKKKDPTPGDHFSNRSGSLVPVEFVKDPVKSFKALTGKLNAGPGGEALSLLWILILILLIAYIAGLLLDNFGLGWVIHILLVIILVLLILWLLRIL
jgi:hypothetical protein